MNPPLVSVLIPCYADRYSLPVALSSVVAQTYSNWECILVDDGSPVPLDDLARRLPDERIRYIRLKQRAGRPAARQATVEHARGDYLCMLDSDDWMYPSRIERQVDVLVSQRDIVGVSAALALLDHNGDLTGIRGRGGTSGGSFRIVHTTRPELPSFAFPASLVRADLAKQYVFDRALMRSEDADFLVRLVMNRRFAVLPDVLYAYAEQASFELHKVLSSHRYVRTMFRKHRAQFPVWSRFQIATSYGKALAYRALFAIGARRTVLRARSRRPTPTEYRDFVDARRTVMKTMQQRFSNRQASR